MMNFTLSMSKIFTCSTFLKYFSVDQLKKKDWLPATSFSLVLSLRAVGIELIGAIWMIFFFHKYMFEYKSLKKPNFFIFKVFFFEYLLKSMSCFRFHEFPCLIVCLTVEIVHFPFGLFEFFNFCLLVCLII